jgi:hypothetical protein
VLGLSGIGPDVSQKREENHRTAAAFKKGTLDYENFTSAVPSNVFPVVSEKVTASLPGRSTLSGKVKEGFWLIAWVVSPRMTSFPL